MDERASDRSIDPDVMAREFVEHYCMTFNRNRAALGELYQEGSMLTFEGDKIQGAQAIVAKLASLPFQLHDIYNVDCCQDSDPQGGPQCGLLLSVSGAIQLAGENHQSKSMFSQMFILMPTHQGSYQVLNHIFRLFPLTAA
ncbi:nuclear transport factor 2-like [Ananas comosus]|uniref:NTF2-related export protein n=1 Tax=Ananas comosus TaxID=4615 RepID=A0A6P5GRS9_ANACO|nr:nuclear transport factor 2-like [Ananas comosus]